MHFPLPAPRGFSLIPSWNELETEMNIPTARRPKARHLVIGLSLAATALAGTAWADQSAKRPAPPAEITRAEAQSRAIAAFTQADVNKDGKLDRADFEARREARRNAMFDRLDGDRNGQLSRAEFTAAGPRGTEGPDGRESRGHRRGPDGERGPGGGHGRHFGHGGPGGPGGPGGMGRLADSNKDGAVSQAEFVAAALQRFDSTDANKDGKVTTAERQAARDAKRAEWGKQHGRPAPPPPPPPAS